MLAGNFRRHQFLVDQNREQQVLIDEDRGRQVSGACGQQILAEGTRGQQILLEIGLLQERGQFYFRGYKTYFFFFRSSRVADSCRSWKTTGAWRRNSTTIDVHI